MNVEDKALLCVVTGGLIDFKNVLNASDLSGNFCQTYYSGWLCTAEYRDARVSVLSLRRNWVPLLPHPQASVAPPLLGPRGEAHSLAGEGVGGPMPTKGQTL
jgi:hypothetical protein